MDEYRSEKPPAAVYETSTTTMKHQLLKIKFKQ